MNACWKTKALLGGVGTESVRFHGSSVGAHRKPHACLHLVESKEMRYLLSDQIRVPARRRLVPGCQVGSFPFFFQWESCVLRFTGSGRTAVHRGEL